MKNKLQKGDALSVKDVAHILSVTDRTLRNWQRKGLIPYSKIGRKVIFLRSDIVALLNANKRGK